MDLKNISKQVIDIITVFSILLLPIYIIFAFISEQIPEFYYSWSIISSVIADYTAFGFILFFLIFFISFRYKEKVSYNFLFIVILVITGFILIFLSFTWRYELYISLIIISGPLSGFSLTLLHEFIVKNIYPKQENKTNIIISLGVFLGFLLYSFILFNFLGVLYWRWIYVITGILIILASFYLVTTIKT